MSQVEEAVLLNAAEASQRYGLTERSLRDMVYRRQVPYVKVGPRRLRFHRETCDAFFAGRVVMPVGEEAVR